MISTVNARRAKPAEAISCLGDCFASLAMTRSFHFPFFQSSYRFFASSFGG